MKGKTGMRCIFAMLFLGVLLTSVCLAQQPTQDVVHLKNGETIRGTIVEAIPGISVKLRTPDGNIHLFDMGEIESIATETISLDSLAEEQSNKIEPWYLYFALGYGKAYYPDFLKQRVDALGSNSHIGLSVEAPGVYWPLHDRHTLLGGSLNGIVDQYDSIEIYQYLLSLGAMHFLTGEIGDGFFLRGDLGIAMVNVQSSPGGSNSNQAGFGILLGGGYAYPVSDETRITVNVNYGMRRVKSDLHGALSINIGVLL